MAGFDVTGVDINAQPNYPFEFVCADWHDYLRDNWQQFDVIHASPPCQAYSGMRHITISRYGSAPDHPDLIAHVRQKLIETGKVYVIENVRGSPVETQIILCGAAFGHERLSRHRHFESSILLPAPPACRCRDNDISIGIYGDKPDGRRVSYRHHKFSRVALSVDEAKNLMQIPWMNEWDEIKEAIPPAYTHWIGNHVRYFLLNSADR